MNIDNLNPCRKCNDPICGFFDGVGDELCEKPCERGQDYLELVRLANQKDTKQQRFDRIYKAVQNMARPCEYCKKIIFPDVKFTKQGGYKLFQKITTVYTPGNVGASYNAVCDECAAFLLSLDGDLTYDKEAACDNGN